MPEALCNAAWELSDRNKWVTSCSYIRVQSVSAVNTAVSIVGMLDYVLKADQHTIYAKHLSVISTTGLQLFQDLPI